MHSPEELKMLIATADAAGGAAAGSFQEEVIHRAIELNAPGDDAGNYDSARARSFSLPVRTHAAGGWRVREDYRRAAFADSGVRSRNAWAGAHYRRSLYSKDVARLMHFRSVSAGAGGQRARFGALRCGR